MSHRVTRFAAIATASVVAVATVVIGGGGSSFTGTSAGASATPFRMMIDAPISSAALAANATTAVNAAKAAVKVINKSGGVLGHKIVLTVSDDGGSPTTAVTKLEAAINSGNKPNVYLAAAASDMSAAVLPILTQNKIISMNEAPTATSGQPSVDPYNFDLSPSTTNYAEAFCPYVKAKGGKSVAILHGNDAYGDPLALAMQAACTADGVTVTGVQQFATTSLDMTAQLEALKAGNPDYLLLQAYGAPAGYIMQDIQKIGWNVPILGDDSVSVSAVINEAPPTGFLGTSLLNNLLVQTFACTVYQPPAKQSAALNNMINGMKSFGPITTTLILAYMYDGVVLASYGAKSAKTTTNAAAIAKAIVKLKPGGPPTGVFPAYHFTSASHSPNVAVSAFSFTKVTKVINGQFGAPGSGA